MKRRSSYGSDRMTRAHNRTSAMAIIAVRAANGTLDTIDRAGMCRSYGIGEADLDAMIGDARQRMAS